MISFQNIEILLGFLLEQFYLHPIHFSLHPIREMGMKTWVCVIWGVERKKLGVNRISLSFKGKL